MTLLDIALIVVALAGLVQLVAKETGYVQRKGWNVMEAK